MSATPDRIPDEIPEAPAEPRARPSGVDQGTAPKISRSGASEDRRGRRGADGDMWFNLALSHLIRRYEPALAWLLDDPRSIESGIGQIRKKAIISELGKLRNGLVSQVD